MFLILVKRLLANIQKFLHALHHGAFKQKSPHLNGRTLNEILLEMDIFFPPD
jgi:hypothetical protein